MNVLLGDSIVWTSIAICFFVLHHPTVKFNSNILTLKLNLYTQRAWV